MSFCCRLLFSSFLVNPFHSLALSVTYNQIQLFENLYPCNNEDDTKTPTPELIVRQSVRLLVRLCVVARTRVWLRDWQPTMRYSMYSQFSGQIAD